jgi:type II restriction enzyme
VRLIDVLWLSKGTDQVAAAFEVEHTTSIYSGILRLLDLATGITNVGDLRLFLVAPDGRENDVRDQLLRPAFRNRALQLKYLPYGALEENRISMARFGTGIKPVEAIARILS